jgi:6-phosphogluconate dehydrogenase (decarboxylating)
MAGPASITDSVVVAPVRGDLRVGLFGNHTGLAQRLTAAGVGVVVIGGDDASLSGLGICCIDRLDGFFDALEHPRCFVLDLPVGGEVDRVIDEAYVVMEPGDVVLDMTPSYWGDTLRRFRRMRHRSIYYVDGALIGGGTIALVAGDERGVAHSVPVIDDIADLVSLLLE